MTGRLEGKRAVVVGGGQTQGKTIGNGRATALVFAREGAHVMVVDRDRHSAHETVKLIDQQGGRAQLHEANIVNEIDCIELAAAVRAELGGLDVLHNNVGVVGGDDVPPRLSEEAWRRIFDTNVTGMWLTCKHLIPVIRETPGGSVINISSIASLMNAPRSTAYGLSKAAVNSLTCRLALDNARHGIRVNALLLGMMDTPLGVDEVARRKCVSREQVAEARASAVPLGRQGTGWDAAHAALFLASDESTFVTGQLLAVDGGSTLLVAYVPDSARSARD